MNEVMKAGKPADFHDQGVGEVERTDADPRHTAIHEAAHAVIGRKLGLSCGEVSIERQDGDYEGFASIADPRFSWERGDGPKKDLADAFCITLYAGAEAEKHIAGGVDVGDSADCERATACLTWAGVRGASYIGDEAYDRKEASLRARARTLTMVHRLVIEAVAAALLEKSTLSGKEVDYIILRGH